VVVKWLWEPKPTLGRHLEHGKVRFLEQLAGPRQPQLQKVAVRVHPITP
jgi:hypothetical protein